MNDHVAFQQAILANPDEDAPRLIYADWLEEQGDSDRAEFIRLQCSRSRLQLLDESRKQITQREWELLRRHSEEWRAALPTFKHLVWRDWERGFLGAIQVNDMPRVLREADHIFQVAPIQTLLSFNLTDEQAATLAHDPCLQRLRRLILRSQNFTWRGFRFLVESPHANGLTGLHLQRASVLTLEILAQARCLAGLKHLVLEWSSVTHQGLQVLAESPWLNALEGLSIQGGEVYDDAADILVKAPLFRHVEYLDIRFCHRDTVATRMLKKHFGKRLLL